MEFYILRGNPIALVLVSTLCSILTFGYALVSFIKKEPVNYNILPLILFSTLYSMICVIAFYLAYRKESRPFMSPKKYTKVIKENEKYSLYLKNIKEALKKYDGSIMSDNERVIERVIEILSKDK